MKIIRKKIGTYYLKKIKKTYKKISFKKKNQKTKKENIIQKVKKPKKNII